MYRCDKKYLQYITKAVKRKIVYATLVYGHVRLNITILFFDTYSRGQAYLYYRVI